MVPVPAAMRVVYESMSMLRAYISPERRPGCAIVS